MKLPAIITGLCVLFIMALPADEESRKATLAKHQEASSKVANQQDELSADVQQLVIEQTVPKVIELLDQVEVIMDEATDLLEKADTGGGTLAAQTEIIEKIYAAAKEKQKQSGGSQSGGAMMDMMERMMGKGEGEKKGQGKDGVPGDQGGKGQTGQSDTANEATRGGGDGKNQARRVPKASGGANLEIPEEFRKAFDSYNRAVEKKFK
jgi:hypothetical protein